MSKKPWLLRESMARHQRGQALRLVKAVRHLSWLLERPICNRDLETYFKEHPEARPELKKRLGQLLIAISLPSKIHVARIQSIGVLAARAYYSPDSDPKWAQAFALMRREHRRRTERWDLIYEGALYLCSIPHHAAFAKNALAGWWQEYGEIIDCPEAYPIDEKAGPHVYQEPTDWVSRQQAMDYLQAQSLQRRESPISHKRILSNWSFCRRDRYSMRRLLALVRYKWPLQEDDPILEKALFHCLRYGTYKLEEA